MTHEQVDSIEDKLRAAQSLVEQCICDEQGEQASKLLNTLTTLSDAIGAAIHEMWRLRPEE